MADFFKGLRANYTVSAALCILLGLVLLIWPGTTARLLGMMLGGSLLVYGIIQILLYLANKDRTVLSQGMMVLGIVLTVVGLWILTSPQVIIMAIPTIVGILIEIHGVHNVVQAFSLHKEEYEKWWLALLFAVLTIGLGAFLIFNSFEVVETIVRIIGIFLIYDGISDVWILSRIFSVKKNKEKIIDAEYVDVE